MKSIKPYIIGGILFVSVLGTILHFAYGLTGNNYFVGLFTPVNESIWEHTKLIYFPMLIYAIYLNRKLKTDFPCIMSAAITGGITGILLIITLFYTYSGIIGYNFAVADISIFYISVIISFYAVYKSALACKNGKYNDTLRIINILIICVFIIFTVSPPDIPLFISN